MLLKYVSHLVIMTESKSLIIQHMLKSTDSILRLILVLLKIFNRRSFPFGVVSITQALGILLSLSLFFLSAYFCLVFFGCGCILKLFRVFLFHWGGIIWFMVSNNFLKYISTCNSLSSFLSLSFLPITFQYLYFLSPSHSTDNFFPLKAESPSPCLFIFMSPLQSHCPSLKTLQILFFPLLYLQHAACH